MQESKPRQAEARPTNPQLIFEAQANSTFFHVSYN